MTWVHLRLGDVLDVKHGFAFDGQYFADTGEYVLLTPGHCLEQGGFRDRGHGEKFFIGDFLEEFLLREGDLIVVMTDLINRAPILGGSFFVPCDNRYLHNQRLGTVRVTDPTRIDKIFLHYLLNTREYRAQVRGSASGATVRHTSPGRIKNCVVRVPRDVSMQRRIACVLSAYDELRENNQRRMVLLEEAARQLYLEWFVRLRFPGREHTRIVDGVPQGWERTSFEAAMALQRGFDLPTQDRVPGNIPIYGSTGVCGFHDQARVAGPGIVTGRSGSLGQVVFAPRDFWPLNTALWVKEFKRVTPLFALHLMREMDLKQYNGGASVPTLDRKAVHRATIVLSESRLMQMFEEAVTPMFSLITNLSEQNEKLRTARDLLLPRLMSGELVV